MVVFFYNKFDMLNIDTYNFFMNTKHMELFAEAVHEVFNEIGFNELSLEKVENSNMPFDLIANIGLTGDLQGYLIIRSSLENAKKLIDRMLKNLGMVSHEEEFGIFHKEAMGEILNQISGRSTMLLSEHDFNCNITPPSIILGKDIFFDLRSLAASSRYLIHGTFGYIDLFVAIKKFKEIS